MLSVIAFLMQFSFTPLLHNSNINQDNVCTYFEILSQLLMYSIIVIIKYK